MAILIKRYANRKLYNTETSRYITLKGIGELLEANHEVVVIDNETGDDITSVALSQILVDRERTNTSPPDSLITQILGKGGDVLYGALRRGMDDATEGIGDLQNRVRRMVTPEGHGSSTGSADTVASRPSEPRARADDAAGEPPGAASKRDANDRHGFAHWVQHTSPEFERLLQTAVERVFNLLDLPRRSDIDALNHNLERVADAVETLERAFAKGGDERGVDLESEARPPRADDPRAGA